MNLNNEILAQQISEQIALEEHLSFILEDQIENLSKLDYSDARSTLVNIKEKLDTHYVSLNKLLNEVESNSEVKSLTKNGVNHSKSFEKDQFHSKISRMLRDDYTALNQITICNSYLHTTGLALNSSDVASIALSHLQDLAPLVVRIGELVPNIITKELKLEYPDCDQTIAEIALKNIKEAWKKKAILEIQKLD